MHTNSLPPPSSFKDSEWRNVEDEFDNPEQLESLYRQELLQSHPRPSNSSKPSFRSPWLSCLPVQDAITPVTPSESPLMRSIPTSPALSSRISSPTIQQSKSPRQRKTSLLGDLSPSPGLMPSSPHGFGQSRKSISAIQSDEDDRADDAMLEKMSASLISNGSGSGVFPMGESLENSIPSLRALVLPDEGRSSPVIIHDPDNDVNGDSMIPEMSPELNFSPPKQSRSLSFLGIGRRKSVADYDSNPTIGSGGGGGSARDLFADLRSAISTMHEESQVEAEDVMEKYEFEQDMLSRLRESVW